MWRRTVRVELGWRTKAKCLDSGVDRAFGNRELLENARQELKVAARECLDRVQIPAMRQ